MEDNALVFYGETVKALGDGKVGGYLVRFSDENTPDLEGDFFTKETEFGTNATPPVVYHHGLDAKLKSRIIGTSNIKSDEIGLWIEAQLNMRDEYETYIYEMTKKGMVGWSSGAMSHLYEAERTEKARHIKTWIIGEASLTPTPAEPKNEAITLKSLLENASSVEGEKGDAPINELDNGEKEMEPEEKKEEEVQPETLDLEALAEQAATKAVKAYQEAQVIDNAGVYKAAAPKVVKKLGETEFSAFKSYLLTGDGGSSLKASNDTDMNIGTDADGGYAVPTGHYNGIIARREESMLAGKLGVRDIPGIGTTVNVPLDGANSNAFVATGEASAFDRDAPVLGTKAMTLVKYTKKIELSYELLHDEDSKLMAFLNDYVGRAMAQTENSLLLTEVASNGTEFEEFASTGTIAAGEPENILANDALGYYMDDGGSIGWVMRNSVFYNIASITGSDRLYAETPAGSFNRSLLGYDVHVSNNAAAMAASAKSIYFGNWNFVGRREAPGFTVLRDPYSKAANGQVVLHYYFRTVYGVLQAGAIGYGAHASA